MLKVCELLSLDQSDFAFADTALAGRYQAVSFPGSERRRDRPLFGRIGTLLAREYLAPCVFETQSVEPRSTERNDVRPAGAKRCFE